ncbi:MAG: efflux RND transporter periplasmic adaptor subunit [Candidatus Binatia bacterium]
MRFRWELLLVLSLTAATVWLAMGGRLPAWLGVEQEIAVGVVKVKKRATAVTVSVSGAIMPVREVMVVSRLAGRITELRVNEGDAVSAGAVIATVHSKTLAQRHIEVETMVAAARKDLAEKERRLADAEELAAHRREYFQQDLIARRDLEHAEAAAQTAKAQAELARAQLAQQEAVLGQASKIESLNQITAPVGGVVSRSWAKSGATIMESAPILGIAEGGLVKFTGRLAGHQSKGLRKGLHAVLSSVTGAGEALEGHITDLAGAVEDGDAAIEIGVSLQTIKGKFRIGTAASAIVTLDRAKEILLVPHAAIVEQGGTHYLYLIANGHAKRQEIELGAAEGDDIEVRLGVAENDLVIVDNLPGLKPGARVRPAAPALLFKQSRSTS